MEESAIVFKAAHLNTFNSRLLKAKMFIIQIDNKIADAAEATEEQKIKYIMLLLRDSALKWATTFINNNEEIIFESYLLFKQKFLRRFTDLNSVKSVIKKLMNFRQGKTLILKYCIKVMNLMNLVNLRDQAVKTHFF